MSYTKRKGKSAMFTSARDNWKTPAAFYRELHKEFDFDFDPCPANPQFDGLAIDWRERNYVNPPYSATMYKWIEKSYQQYLLNKLVVLLIPARTDTKWFHEFCLKATEIRFIKGRLKFDEHKYSAPFPSMLVVFKPRKKSA